MNFVSKSLAVLACKKWNDKNENMVLAKFRVTCEFSKFELFFLDLYKV